MVAIKSDLLGENALHQVRTEMRRLMAESVGVPRGEYLARLTRLSVDPGVTSLCLVLRFVILSPDEHCGKVVLRRLWITERALQKTLADLRKIGIQDVDQIESEEMELDIVCKIFVEESTSDCSVNFFVPYDV